MFYLNIKKGTISNISFHLHYPKTAIFINSSFMATGKHPVKLIIGSLDLITPYGHKNILSETMPDWTSANVT